MQLQAFVAFQWEIVGAPALLRTNKPGPAAKQLPGCQEKPQIRLLTLLSFYVKHIKVLKRKRKSQKAL